MRLRFALQRSSRGGDWAELGHYGAPPSPTGLGFIGTTHERLRCVCDGVVIELWEWTERIPVNPADLACTDFAPGWKLLWRKDAPTPGAEELAHYFAG